MVIYLLDLEVYRVIGFTGIYNPSKGEKQLENSMKHEMETGLI